MSLINHFSRRLVSVSRAASFSKLNQARMLSYPSHVVVNMPSLSPTMEAGSIAKWNLKVGDKFEPGTSLCDVETDKATISFDATEEGYIAKILVNSGEVKVGEPLLVTVDDAADVPAFADFTVAASSAVAPAAPKSTPTPAPVAAPVAAPVSSQSSTGRIFASPLAKKLIRESNNTLESVHSVLKSGSGPNGRIIAADIPKALELLSKVGTSVPAAAAAAAAPVQATSASPIFETTNASYTDFILSDTAQNLASSYVYSKQHVPHYYVSIELNLSNLLALREQFNTKLAKANPKNPNPPSLSVMDFLVKASAQAMKQVPDLNGSWRDTFIRRYEEVDINIVMGSGANISVPVIRNVNSLGLTAISSSIKELEEKFISEEVSNNESAERFVPGTFTIHNLGNFGVKSASPVIINGQGAALALGAIQDTVIPRLNAAEGEDNWEVAPILVATVSCDHRVVDGAVSAQWLSAFKQLVENPIDLLL